MKYKISVYFWDMVKEKQRAKPGRKPVEDKKIPVTIYIEESVLDSVGRDNARLAARNAVYSLKFKNKQH